MLRTKRYLSVQAVPISTDYDKLQNALNFAVLGQGENQEGEILTQKLLQRMLASSGLRHDFTVLLI